MLPRPLVLYTLIVTAVVLLASLPTLLGASPDIVAIATPIAQFVPAVASLVLILTMRLGKVGEVWALRPGGVGPLFAGLGLALLAVVAVTGLQLVVVVVSGASPWLGVTDPAVLVAIPVTALVLFLPCLAEEVGWRGFGHHVLHGRGFWATAATMAAIWSVWHLPSMLAYLRHGESSGREVIAVLLSLLFAGLGLSALRERTGSIWAAAVGHVLMNTLVVYAQSNLVRPPSELGDLGFWLLQAAGWVGWLLVAAVLRPRRAAGFRGGS
ncbi:lysostaphin resistance A-like protein [Microlunatus sp. Y2014]|uniref:CPBP family intramembrane glutamic endopeptidase n=1 Tax=Microlunatus sp. Y2014 TaxID=3418488 RepID=UPI003DA7865A